MAHEVTKNGNWKGKRDKHQQPDWTSDKKRNKSSWDGKSGRPTHPSSSAKKKSK